MSWMEYVKRVAPGAAQGDIAKAAGVTSPTVSRWMNQKQGVDPAAAAKFARAHRRPVLEAFVAAGFLTEAEAKVRPSAAPDYSQLSNSELLELVESRMTEEVATNEATSTQKTKLRLTTAAASGGAGDEESEEAAEVGERAAAKQRAAKEAMKDKP